MVRSAPTPLEQRVSQLSVNVPMDSPLLTSLSTSVTEPQSLTVLVWIFREILALTPPFEI